jgi:ketosteroid isomerase-like protein
MSISPSDPVGSEPPRSISSASTLVRASEDQAFASLYNAFYEFRDGKIARNVDCWDPTVLMEQMGVRAARLDALRSGSAA